MTDRVEAVCAIDIGTSGVRAVVTTPEGRRLHSASRPHDRGSGATRFDPERLWKTVAATLQELLGPAQAVELEGLGVTGHLGTVFLDEREAPVGDGITWADAHGVDALERVLRDHPDAASTTGRSRPSGSSFAAYLDLRERAGDEARRVRTILSPKDFVIQRLTGRAVVDPTTAAYSFAFDVGARAWSEALVAAAGADPSWFPDVVEAGEVVGVTTAAAADASGLRKGLPVVAGGPDGSVGVFGAAGLRTDVITDIAGTTDVLARCTPTRPKGLEPQVVVNPYLAASFWTVGGPTGSTGGAVDRIAFLTGHGNLATALDALAGELAELAPGADGLLVSPHLNGSRFPFWEAGERFAVWGLDASHTVAHLLRATQEGAAFVVRAGIECMESSDERVPLVLGGGTAKASCQAQLRANVLDRSVEAPSDADVTLAGAAMLAATGCGLHDTLETAWAAMRSPVELYEPDRERAGAYHEVFARWRDARHNLPAAKEDE